MGPPPNVEMEATVLARADEARVLIMAVSPNGSDEYNFKDAVLDELLWDRNVCRVDLRLATTTWNLTTSNVGVNLSCLTWYTLEDPEVS